MRMLAELGDLVLELTHFNYQFMLSFFSLKGRKSLFLFKGDIADLAQSRAHGPALMLVPLQRVPELGFQQALLPLQVQERVLQQSMGGPFTLDSLAQFLDLLS
jgi:hypothetical protein